MKKVTNANFESLFQRSFDRSRNLDPKQFLQVLRMTKKKFVSPREQRKIFAFELRYHPYKPDLVYREIAQQLGVSENRGRVLAREGEGLFDEVCREYRDKLIPAIPKQTLEKIESLRRGPLYLVLDVVTNSMCLESRERFLYQKLVGFQVNIDFTVTQMTEEEIAEFYQ